MTRGLAATLAWPVLLVAGFAPVASAQAAWQPLSDSAYKAQLVEQARRDSINTVLYVELVTARREMWRGIARF